MKLEWRGWVLDGCLLLSPRRVRLSSSEASILAALIEYRKKGHRGIPAHMPTEELLVASGQKSKSALRSRMATLRTAVGPNAIHRIRLKGYALHPVSERYGTTKELIDDLIENLEASLVTARRIKESIKEGLY